MYPEAEFLGRKKCESLKLYLGEERSGCPYLCRCSLGDVLHRHTSEDCGKITVRDCSTLLYTLWMHIKVF
jgi:hypothetical protein